MKKKIKEMRCKEDTRKVAYSGNKMFPGTWTYFHARSQQNFPVTLLLVSPVPTNSLMNGIYLVQFQVVMKPDEVMQIVFRINNYDNRRQIS